ncbi:hypothetical protein CBW65_12030 [Tumebacillus avium]|uniref:Lipoprotein n=1 Tax=Tumebacillus avium TaxID=1903704 RepID=A0A1Y0IQD0_9BACL|nr:hypothetical protein [Tumebacillus avium]ARU61665.1 hypothetical protein CBW65_12030 [Tumebacillus avium]
MKKTIGALFLAVTLIATGCASGASDQEAAEEVAKNFDKAVLDYANRAEGEDLKGTEYATERAQKEMKEELLSYYDFVHNVRGRSDLPEVQDVIIKDVYKTKVDGQDGYIINTVVVYNPDRFVFHRNVGLKLISLEGAWKVAYFDFHQHFGEPK